MPFRTLHLLMLSLVAAPSFSFGEESVDANSTPLQKFQQIADKIYCGGEPSNDGAFAKLKMLGIRTIVSVDGARPDIKSAQSFGLEYVHIPTSYDGIGKFAGLSLARLVRDKEGPFYIHCHHGLHRGPAAAAVACIANGDVDHVGALKILEHSGTSKDYAGLWRSVETYLAPARTAQLPELVEVADTETLATAMAKLDRVFENLIERRDANWAKHPDCPDLLPHQQALMLEERLRESRRSLSDPFDPPFQSWLADAEERARSVKNALANDDFKSAERGLQALSKSCTRCHEQYRN